MSLAKKVAGPTVALMVVLIFVGPASAGAGTVVRSSGDRSTGSVSWIAWALGGQGISGLTARLFGWVSAETTQVVGPDGKVVSGSNPATSPAEITDLDKGAGIDPNGGH